MEAFDTLPAPVAAQIVREMSEQACLPHFNITREQGYAGAGCGWVEFAESGKLLRMRYATSLDEDGDTEQNCWTTERHILHFANEEHQEEYFWATIDREYGHPETGDPEQIIDLTPAPGDWITTSTGAIRVFANFSCYAAVLREE